MYLKARHQLARSSNRVGPGNALTWTSRRHWLGLLEISDNGRVVARGHLLSETHIVQFVLGPENFSAVGTIVVALQLVHHSDSNYSSIYHVLVFEYLN